MEGGGDVGESGAALGVPEDENGGHERRREGRGGEGRGREGREREKSRGWKRRVEERVSR